MSFSTCDLKVISLVSVTQAAEEYMVLTLIHVPSGKIMTLPAIPVNPGSYELASSTGYRGIRPLLDVLGFSVEDVILGEDDMSASPVLGG